MDSNSRSNLELTVFIPVCDEEENIDKLYFELFKVLNEINVSFEVIFVDDGSRDKSFEKLKKLSESDARIKVIRFKKNFGQTAAFRAAIEHSQGKLFIPMDADLQNDPVDIPRLIQKAEEGYDVVSGWRKKRKDPLLSRTIPSKIANSLISWVTGIHLHDYGCSLKLYRRETLNPEALCGEMHRFLPAFAGWQGAKICEIEVNHHPRMHGVSKYGLFRIFKVVIDLITVKFITGYSAKPSYMFSAVGCPLIFFGGICFFIVAYRALILERLQATPLVFLMVIFILAGLQLILMGLLSEIQIRQRTGTGENYIYTTEKMINFNEGKGHNLQEQEENGHSEISH
jgi:glycosyltransferase involved in cell wall biosynthesis